MTRLSCAPNGAVAAARKPAALFVRDQGAAVPETFCTSGTSPSVHLIGAGPVGRALLALCAEAGFRVVGISDSTATVHDRRGLDLRELAAFKAAGGSLSDRPGGERVRVDLAIDLVAADVVVDAAATRIDRPAAAVARGRAALRRGATLVLASKDGLCAAVAEWLDSRHRVGVDAALGGTGRFLREQLGELRTRARGAAIVANASTTAILERIERGGDLAAGLAAARERGLLESDPELDLRGEDAATKLAIVAGALSGVAVDPRAIARPDLRALDPSTVQERAGRGATTRLVGRWVRGALPALAYEEVPRGSALAVPCDRVVYAYGLDDGSLRVHTGAGIGPERTARAAFHDLRRAAEAIGGAA